MLRETENRLKLADPVVWRELAIHELGEVVSWKRRPSPLVTGVVLVKPLGQLAQKKCDRMAREVGEAEPLQKAWLEARPIGSSPAD